MVDAGHARVSGEAGGAHVGRLPPLGQETLRDRSRGIGYLAYCLDFAGSTARHENSNALLGENLQVAEKGRGVAVVSDRIVARHFRSEEHKAEISGRRRLAWRHHLVEPRLGKDADAIERTAVY